MIVELCSEDRAGMKARRCSRCDRWTVHQSTQICLACGEDHHDDFLGLPPRWPYGGPSYHQDCCILHQLAGRGECDCLASDASDTEWGEDGDATPYHPDTRKK